MVHWDETFRTLRQVNYDGWLTIESFGRALPDLSASADLVVIGRHPGHSGLQGLGSVRHAVLHHAPIAASDAARVG